MVSSLGFENRSAPVLFFNHYIIAAIKKNIYSTQYDGEKQPLPQKQDGCHDKRMNIQLGSLRAYPGISHG
jgi:hypothetical protein